MKSITVLGSTGSVGKNTLDLLLKHSDKFKVFALTAKSNTSLLLCQCKQFNPCYAVVEKADDAYFLEKEFKAANLRTQALWGAKALREVASTAEVDYVMAGIVGAAGLLPTLAAAQTGKRILLANKEALIMSGALFMETVRKSGAILLPVDSEHNAIFQCMPSGYRAGETPTGLEKISLTASGGPFRTLPLGEFSKVSWEQAVAHPNWRMGAKISVDSATMMNKGLEVIEAFWLFNLNISQIEVVVHPQSIIHSMVYYFDGSVLAQLGTPDMRTPIAYTLSWPERIYTPVKRLDLVEIGGLTFEAADTLRFPCLKLAYSAIRAGGTASTILNAANEVAVAAFLESKILFTDIPCIIEEVLNKVDLRPAECYEVLHEADQIARSRARKALERLQCASLIGP
jgi:1-deoxy-D-xylulose-5-phosphate reductoisomerase